MQLLTFPPATSEILVSAVSTSELPAATPAPQRSKLSMWHKEWDGNRERMVADWVLHP